MAELCEKKGKFCLQQHQEWKNTACEEAFKSAK